MAYYGDERDKYSSEKLNKIKKEGNFPIYPSKINKNNVLGFGKKDNYALHAIIIKKKVDRKRADEIVKHILHSKKVPFMRETKASFRYRNIPKQKFQPKSYRTKKINKGISLIFGKLKPEFVKLSGGAWYDWFSDAWDTVSKGATDLWEGVKDTAVQVWDTVKDTATGIWNEVVSPDEPEPEEEEEEEEEEEPEEDSKRESKIVDDLPPPKDKLNTITDIQDKKEQKEPAKEEMKMEEEEEEEPEALYKEEFKKPISDISKVEELLKQLLNDKSKITDSKSKINYVHIPKTYFIPNSFKEQVTNMGKRTTGKLKKKYNKLKGSGIFDTLKSGYEKVKSKAKDLYKEAKSRGSTLLTGTNYVGPFNALDEEYIRTHPPTDIIDQGAKEHDEKYSELAKLRDEKKISQKEADKLIRESDEKFLKNIRDNYKANPWASLLGYAGIKGKTLAEDYLGLDRNKFVAQGARKIAKPYAEQYMQVHNELKRFKGGAKTVKKSLINKAFKENLITKEFIIEFMKTSEENLKKLEDKINSLIKEGVDYLVKQYKNDKLNMKDDTSLKNLLIDIEQFISSNNTRALKKQNKTRIALAKKIKKLINKKRTVRTEKTLNDLIKKYNPQIEPEQNLFNVEAPQEPVYEPASEYESSEEEEVLPQPLSTQEIETEISRFRDYVNNDMYSSQVRSAAAKIYKNLMIRSRSSFLDNEARILISNFNRTYSDIIDVDEEKEEDEDEDEEDYDVENASEIRRINEIFGTPKMTKEYFNTIEDTLDDLDYSVETPLIKFLSKLADAIRELINKERTPTRDIKLNELYNKFINAMVGDYQDRDIMRQSYNPDNEVFEVLRATQEEAYTYREKRKAREGIPYTRPARQEIAVEPVEPPYPEIVKNINLQWGLFYPPQLQSTPSIASVENFRRDFKELMKDSPLNARKSFIFSMKDNEQKDNEKYKLLMNCIPVIQSIRMQHTGARGQMSWPLNKNMGGRGGSYALVFQRKQKDNGEEYYIMNACGELTIDEDSKGFNFIYIDMLRGAEGAGGAFAMFADMKDIVENKNGKGEFITLEKIAYINLSALPSFGTLNVYDRDGGLITVPDYNTQKTDIKGIFDDIKTDDIAEYNSFKALRQQYETNKTLEGEDKKAADQLLLKDMDLFWDSNFENSLGLPHYYWILNTPLKQKLLEKIPAYVNLVRFSPKLIMENQFKLQGYGVPMMLINKNKMKGGLKIGKRDKYTSLFSAPKEEYYVESNPYEEYYQWGF